MLERSYFFSSCVAVEHSVHLVIFYAFQHPFSIFVVRYKKTIFQGRYLMPPYGGNGSEGVKKFALQGKLKISDYLHVIYILDYIYFASYLTQLVFK